MRVDFCDETEHGFGWIHPEPALMQRASHALAIDGRVWILDPADGDGVEERIRGLGEPAGVLTLLDRHPRDAASLADRLGVAHHELPFDGVEGCPLEFRRVIDVGVWKEVAAWWPQGRVLYVPEAVGSPDYFRAGDEPVGVHPMLRLIPPRERFAGLEPEHLLFGHGRGLHGARAAEALHEALEHSRRRWPQWAATQAAGAARAAYRALRS